MPWDEVAPRSSATAVTETFMAHKRQVQLCFVSAALNFKAEERHKNKWRTTDCVSAGMCFWMLGVLHAGFQGVGEERSPPTLLSQLLSASETPAGTNIG